MSDILLTEMYNANEDIWSQVEKWKEGHPNHFVWAFTNSKTDSGITAYVDANKVGMLTSSKLNSGSSERFYKQGESLIGSSIKDVIAALADKGYKNDNPGGTSADEIKTRDRAYLKSLGW